MEKYNLEIKPSASKELESLGTKKDRQRLVKRIEALANEPRPHGCEKLQQSDDRYRIRQGRYRIIYSIDDRARVVVIFKIGHHKEIYR